MGREEAGEAEMRMTREARRSALSQHITHSGMYCRSRRFNIAFSFIRLIVHLFQCISCMPPCPLLINKSSPMRQWYCAENNKATINHSHPSSRNQKRKSSVKLKC